MNFAHGAVVAALTAALTWPAGTACAHAILMRSEPAVGATLPPGPLKIVLEYNSRIDFRRSVVKLSGPDQQGTTLGLGQQAANVAGATADVTTPGAYTIKWQVLATDGHITRGIVPFVVSGRSAATDTAGQ